ncbi:MAG: SUMF1/EgtB/PvdO family nonheme iron enzyme [Succinivibrio sp.]
MKALFFSLIIGVLSVMPVWPNEFLYRESHLPPSIYNPKPMEDDLVLPLPCGDKDNVIVFRKVYTGTNSDTSTYSFEDGSDKRNGHISQLKRKCNVKGSLKDDKGYYFYLSKYELTKGQYESIVNKKCDSARRLDALPVVQISIDDARQAAQKYSDFLQSYNDAPSIKGEKATASLPDECFWSFAQRGGLAVSRTELEKDIPTIDNGEELESYIWALGPGNSNGKLQLIGRKKPNQLGFFDMLGNAAEFMENPFTLSSELTSASGQIGASTIRGGSYMNPIGEIVNSSRSEKKKYTSKGEPNTAKNIGTRLMLNFSMLQDNETYSKLVKEINELASTIDSLEKKNKSAISDHEKFNNSKVIADLKKQLSENEKKVSDLLGEISYVKSQKSNTLFLIIALFFVFFVIVAIIDLIVRKLNSRKQKNNRIIYDAYDIEGGYTASGLNRRNNRFKDGFINRR